MNWDPTTKTIHLDPEVVIVHWHDFKSDEWLGTQQGLPPGVEPKEGCTVRMNDGVEYRIEDVRFIIGANTIKLYISPVPKAVDRPQA